MREVMVPSEFLSIAAAASALGVSRQAVYNWIAQGRLILYLVGDDRRVLKAEVERLRQERAKPKDGA